MRIYAVVVTFNGEQWIGKCIDSLIQSSIPLNIVVIDNQSDDSTISIVESYADRVHLIRSDKNLGFGQANNLGIKHGYYDHADYFFLLNQDAWIEKQTIHDLIQIHQRNTGYGILTPVQLNRDRSRIDDNFLYYMYKTDNILSDVYLNKTKDVYPTTFANAAAWLLSRECIRRTGLFDPFFYHYSEDRNFCHRAIFHGFKIGICPGINVVHDRGERRRETDKKKIRDNGFREEVTDLIDIRNGNFEKSFRSAKSIRIKNIVKALAKLDMQRFRQNLNELRYLSRRKSDMDSSFKRNRIGGESYLENI